MTYTVNNVTVVLQIVMNFTGQTTVQLMVFYILYNMLYNVTIATLVCGHTAPTTVTQLKYSEILLIFCKNYYNIIYNIYILYVYIFSVQYENFLSQLNQMLVQLK